LVTSPKSVETSAERGLWFLGTSPAGNLYLAERRGLSALAPYTVWHDDPETATYYLAYDYVAGGISAAAPFGEVEPLGGAAFLITVPRGGEAALTTAGLRLELTRLAPQPPAAGLDNDAEPPPAYDDDVAAALRKITRTRVKGYLTALQDFETRFSYAEGYGEAASWARDFFTGLGYETSYDEFFGVEFDAVSMPTDGRKIWITTDGGTVYHSTNRGNRWTVQATPAKGFLWSIQFLNENVGYSVGAGGTCLKTTNGGQRWTAQNVPYSGYLFGVGFVDANTGWIAGDAGKIFHTANGGTRWAEQTTPTSSRLYDIAMADATHGWACGRSGVILRTEDGQTWTRQNSNTTTRLYGIYAVSANEAWACGWAKTVLHTTDGGQTWTQVEISQPSWAYFYDVRFGDARHGYVVGTAGTFLYTSDGGATWSYKQVGEASFQGCDFASGSFGVLAGSGALYRTSDGGGSFASLLDTFDDKWRNVVAEKKGRTRPDEIVIICGHMDCTSERPLESAPGAEDNGSGTAATLAAAYALADLDFERTLRFICWCGEEQGLLGSRHYASAAAENKENIVGVVNLDMVAYDEEKGKRDDTSNFTNNESKWLAEYLIAAAALYDVDHQFDLIVDPEAGGSDHAAFWAVGYEAIFLIEGESGGPGGVLDYPWYHTTQDTVDKLSMKFQVDCSRAATATVAHLARPRATPHVGEPVPPGGQPGPFVVYPNPYKAGAGPGYVRFDGVDAGATVEIYDLAGSLIFSHLVTAEAGHYDWSVVSNDGAAAASGLYLYRVTGAGRDESGKLAILR
jgi:photosystem II stability/assembly factor-like uncharacterized protein